MKIICIGRNYHEHTKELNNAIPEKPIIFIKPDTALLKGSDFYIPEFSNEIHYELELIIKISKGGKYIQQENAHKHYETIGLGIDFTARDLQNELKQKGLPWEIAKGFDNSAVVSNFLPKNSYPLDDLSFTLQRNGKEMQRGNSREMIFSIDQLVSYASQFFTLRVGDILFTGTPAGVGKVEENDVLQAYLEGEKLLDLRIL